MAGEDNSDQLSVLRLEITRMRESIIGYKEKNKQLNGQITALNGRVAVLMRETAKMKDENESLKARLQQGPVPGDTASAEDSPERRELPDLMGEMLAERWWIHLSHRVEELYVRLERQNEQINKLLKDRRTGSQAYRQQQARPELPARPPRIAEAAPEEEKEKIHVKLTPAALELTDWQKANIARSIREHERKRHLQKAVTVPEALKKTPAAAMPVDPEELDLPVYATGPKDKGVLSKWFATRFGKSET